MSDLKTESKTDSKTDFKKDWKSLARAGGLTIPSSALERVAQTLEALEADFRPLVRALPRESEPALAFHAATHDDGENAE
jgi:hypothetical protein